MNKRLIALAVAAAVSAPAVVLADDSTVTLYGTLNMDFENVKADGAATGANIPSRNRVTQNSSNIGFRGAEDLGGGLKAVFQIEQGVNLDTGASSASTGSFATRNSKLGLAGGFGEVFFGNWDTPYKLSTVLGGIDAFYTAGIAQYTDVLSGNNSPTTANAANRASFDRRENNSVQYISPNFSGFGFRAAYAANEEKTNSAASPQQDPKLWSVSGSYANGPLYVSLAYEKHDEYANTTTEKSKDTGVKLSAAYTLFGTTTVGFVAERLEYEGNLATFSGLNKTVTLGTADEAKLDAYYVSLQHRMGPHTIRGAYGWDRGLKLTGGTGSADANTKAKMFAVGYSYSMSKRTDLYALYAKIKNEDNSSNNFSVGTALPAFGAGADPTGFGVGVRHTF
ncbi:MAG: porin [Pseudomonadota bacterium]